MFACLRQIGKKTSETDELKKLLIAEEMISFRYLCKKIGTELSLRFYFVKS